MWAIASIVGAEARQPGGMPPPLVLLISLLAWTIGTQAQIVEDVEDQDSEPEKGSFFLPYYFQTDAMEDGIGLSYTGGLFDASGGLFAAAYFTANDSWGLTFSGHDYSLTGGRWFLDAMVRYEDNTDQRFYGDIASPVGGPAGGEHNSPPDDYLAGPGQTTRFETVFRYVLPLGDGRNNVMARYQTDSGILHGPPSGGSEWNPRTSGRTDLTLKPFLQRRSLAITEVNIHQFPHVLGVAVGDTLTHETNGLEVALTYDNRDFMLNPERGSFQRFAVTRDFDWLDSSDAWTSMELDYRKYFNLGAGEAYLQKVFALHAWSAYVPSFTRTRVEDFVVFSRTPPSNMGATLGGSERMRAYPVGRFSDKAALYYSAELRLIPKWNPIRDWPFIRNLPMRWVQWVIFAEAGRVAPSWQLDTLHEDMNTNVGVSLRSMIGGQVVRLELVGGEETTQFWVQVGHPF